MTWTCLCEEHSEPVLSGRSVPLHNNTFPSLALSHITRVWKASLLQEIDLAGYRGELPSSSNSSLELVAHTHAHLSIRPMSSSDP